MCFKQFKPFFSNFDLDIRILVVKIYKKQLFLSKDILLHTGRYPQILDYRLRFAAGLSAAGTRNLNKKDRSIIICIIKSMIYQ